MAGGRTAAPPGSEEKVTVLEQRARLGQSLWHPMDAPMDIESRRLGDLAAQALLVGRGEDLAPVDWKDGC